MEEYRIADGRKEKRATIAGRPFSSNLKFEI
jgi:hypothetical protein